MTLICTALITGTQ